MDYAVEAAAEDAASPVLVVEVRGLVHLLVVLLLRGGSKQASLVELRRILLLGVGVVGTD